MMRNPAYLLTQVVGVATGREVTRVMTRWPAGQRT
jgi:hypothetical protein